MEVILGPRFLKQGSRRTPHFHTLVTSTRHFHRRVTFFSPRNPSSSQKFVSCCVELTDSCGSDEFVWNWRICVEVTRRSDRFVMKCGVSVMNFVDWTGTGPCVEVTCRTEVFEILAILKILAIIDFFFILVLQNYFRKLIPANIGKIIDFWAR